MQNEYIIVSMQVGQCVTILSEADFVISKLSLHDTIGSHAFRVGNNAIGWLLVYTSDQLIGLCEPCSVTDARLLALSSYVAKLCVVVVTVAVLAFHRVLRNRNVEVTSKVRSLIHFHCRVSRKFVVGC